MLLRTFNWKFDLQHSVQGGDVSTPFSDVEASCAFGHKEKKHKMVGSGPHSQHEFGQGVQVGVLEHTLD